MADLFADCAFKHTLSDVKECNMYKLGFCIYGEHIGILLGRVGPPRGTQLCFLTCRAAMHVQAHKDQGPSTRP